MGGHWYDLLNERMRAGNVLCGMSEGGAIVASPSGQIKRQGNMATGNLAKEHLDRARRGGAPILFVYDFALASTPLSELKFVFDAERQPIVAPGENFEEKYGPFPRQLAFQDAKARKVSKNIDWFTNIYT